MSFREYQAVIDGAVARSRVERSLAMSIAWHTAAFQRAKRMPRHNAVVDEPKRKPGALAPAELQAKVASWLSNRKRR